MNNYGNSSLPKALCPRTQAFLLKIIPTLLAIGFVAAFSGYVPARQPPHDVQYKAIARDPRYRATPADVGKGDLYALVVGISNYKDPDIHPLTVADKDAEAFANFIDTQKQVFKNIHLKLLLNEQATREAILDYLNEEVSKCGKDDTVILFLSGHGANDLRHPDDTYFLGYDARAKSIAATGVKMNGLDFLKGLEAPRILVIADACHSGGIAEGLNIRGGPTPSWQTVVKGLEQSSGRVLLASSRKDQYSMEKQGLPNGVFTYYLLKALHGEADSSRKGVVTLALSVPGRLRPHQGRDRRTPTPPNDRVHGRSIPAGNDPPSGDTTPIGSVFHRPRSRLQRPRLHRPSARGVPVFRSPLRRRGNK